jgi:hypothetical protein
VDSDEAIERIELSVQAIKKFFIQADTLKDRRTDAAGPSLLRTLKTIWAKASKEALRDIEDACERLLFPIPANSSSSSSSPYPSTSRLRAGVRGGGGGGGRQGYRGRERDSYGGGDGSVHSRVPGFGPHSQSQNREATYAYYPPAYPPAHQAMAMPAPHGGNVMYAHAPPPAASATRVAGGEHNDKCVYCNGEHLSQRCFRQFPHLRPPPRERA